MLTRLMTIERRFAWGFFGVAITVGVLAREYIFPARSSLRYELLADSRALDIIGPIGPLECFYDGQRLEQGADELRLLVVRIVNDGDNTILREHYDDLPIGLHLSQGEVIETPTVSSGVRYIADNMIVTVLDGERISFSKLILEPSDSFNISFIVRTRPDVELRIEPIGKIAMVNEISVSSFRDKDVGDRLRLDLDAAFAGGPNVQSFRLVGYLSLTIAILFMTFAALRAISDLWVVVDRRRVKSKFLSSIGGRLPEGEMRVIDTVLSCRNLGDLLREMREALSRYDIDVLVNNATLYKPRQIKERSGLLWQSGGTTRATALLLYLGVLHNDGTGIAVDEKKLNVLMQLSKFLHDCGFVVHGGEWAINLNRFRRTPSE